MVRIGHKRVPTLRTFRARKGLTQQQLADQMDVARSTVGWLEASGSSRKPGRELAEKVGGVLGWPWWRVIEEYDRLRGVR